MGRIPTENKRLKGLPIVNYRLDLNHKLYKLKLPWFWQSKVTYEVFLWSITIFFNLITVYFYSWYFDFSNERLGYNFNRIMCTFLSFHCVDLVSGLYLYFVKGFRGNLIRYSATWDNFTMVIYGLLLPIVFDNHLLHFLLIISRDLTTASVADILRIYFWPDNLHNRKRVANFIQISEVHGNYFWLQLLKTPAVRAFTEHVGMVWFITPDKLDWDVTDLFMLMFKIGVYEIINDFFYYWLHRYAHENVWVYKNVHKLHHTSKCPTALNSATMTMAETFFTFILSDWFTPFLMHQFLPMTCTEFAFWSWWICSIEVYGHSGHGLDNNTLSIWRFGLCGIFSNLGFMMEQKDHEIHHWNNKFNYCKRTQLWDKIFGTFDYHNREIAGDVAGEPLKEAIKEVKAKTETAM